MLSDELFERCLRAVMLAPPDKPSLALLLDMATVQVDAFTAALELAFAAGRESAYDRDEWRVVAVHPRSGELLMNEQRGEDAARVLLKAARTFDPDARLEHRRVAGDPAWVRVPEAGGPNELQA